MKTQPNILVCVLIALVIHVVIACAVLWNAEAKPLEFAEMAQGMEITLDRHAYQNILQKQQQATVKKAATKPVETTKTKVKKSVVKKQKKAKAIQQKAVTEVQQTKVVTYQVEEKTVEQVMPVTEAAVNEVAEPVKVASAANTPLQTAAVNAPQKSAAGVSGTSNQKPLDMRDSVTKRYIAALMRHLKRYKHYPALMKKNHIEGKPVIRFSINKSGQVTNVEVKRRSQSAELDQTAMDVFRRASPLPKIPSELERETLTMSLPIEYSLIND